MKQVTNLNERSQYYASSELLAQLDSKMNKGDFLVNFAYTDYGGDFFDKVCIEYFAEKFPENTVWEHTGWSGKNAFIFGETAKDFFEATERYLLGFEDIEEYYSNMSYNEERNGFKYFIESLDIDKYEISPDAIDMLCDLRGGYYSVHTSGLDYSETDLIEYCIESGIIKEITNA